MPPSKSMNRTLITGNCNEMRSYCRKTINDQKLLHILFHIEKNSSKKGESFIPFAKHYFSDQMPPELMPVEIARAAAVSDL